MVCVPVGLFERPAFDATSANSLPEWQPFGLHPQLGRVLLSKKFSNPTPIQAQSLPLALKHRDVVGVAETVRNSPAYIYTFV